MQLQAYTEYAIQILQYLHAHPQGLRTGTELAEELGISYPTFLALAVKLRRAGLIVSVRGRNGGFSLNKPAKKIRVYDVFLCIEGDLCISRNLKPGRSKSDDKMQQFLKSWQESIIAELSNTTVADLAS